MRTIEAGTAVRDPCERMHERMSYVNAMSCVCVRFQRVEGRRRGDDATRLDDDTKKFFDAIKTPNLQISKRCSSAKN